MDTYNTTFTCPYNPAHVFLKGRIQGHLIRCRTQYEQANACKLEYGTCSFNNTHIIPTNEIEIHETICVDRRTIDAMIFQEPRLLPEAPCHAKLIQIEDSGENWDDETTVTSTLELIQEKAKTKKVILSLNGAPPAERKKHRLEERQRHRNLSEQQAKK